MVDLFSNGNAFLTGAKAAITFVNRDFDDNDEILPCDITIKKNRYKYVPWGLDNKWPANTLLKIEKSPVMSSNMTFNITAGYGSSIVPFILQDGKVINLYEAEGINNKDEIIRFFETNRINRYLIEQLTDINYFYNAFPEIIFDLGDHGSRKIIQLRSKEAVFSRWGEMDSFGEIKDHFYFSNWGEKTPKNDEAERTAVLSIHGPIIDLEERLNDEARKKVSYSKRVNRYIIPVNMPTPGRTYYQKPPWYSLIESGWYDFAIAIPKFKKALMTNQMTIKYHVEYPADYFETVFQQEGITDDKKKKERIKEEYENLEKYLTGFDNTGKTWITKRKTDLDGKEWGIKINVLDNKMIGGEYIEDSEEVNNITCYSMGVHPSIYGASPGKNKNISGTEARELFLIKQSLLKPVRDILLEPFYLIKWVNKWDARLQFYIPNLQLTTLDNNKSGSEIVINNNSNAV